MAETPLQHELSQETTRAEVQRNRFGGVAIRNQGRRISGFDDAEKHPDDSAATSTSQGDCAPSLTEVDTARDSGSGPARTTSAGATCDSEALDGSGLSQNRLPNDNFRFIDVRPDSDVRPTYATRASIRAAAGCWGSDAIRGNGKSRPSSRSPPEWVVAGLMGAGVVQGAASLLSVSPVAIAVSSKTHLAKKRV